MSNRTDLEAYWTPARSQRTVETSMEAIAILEADFEQAIAALQAWKVKLLEPHYLFTQHPTLCN